MLIIGAGGFAKEILDTLLENGEKDLVFFDDVTPDIKSTVLGSYPLLQSKEAASDYLKTKEKRFLLGVGAPVHRRNLTVLFSSLGGKAHSLISKQAFIGSLQNEIGPGCTILRNVIIEAGNTIGEGVLLHVGAFVSHDVKIGAFSEISPFAKLLGGVTIGAGVSVGTSAVILPRLTIGDGAVIGAGSVVTKDVPAGARVAGVPAKPLQK